MEWVNPDDIASEQGACVAKAKPKATQSKWEAARCHVEEVMRSTSCFIAGMLRHAGRFFLITKIPNIGGTWTSSNLESEKRSKKKKGHFPVLQPPLLP